MTRQEVIGYLMEMREKPVGYFTYEDNYCYVEDCEVDDCEEHDGSLLDYTVTCNSMHEIVSVTVCLGSIGSSFVYFDSEKSCVYTYYEGEEISVGMDRDKRNDIHDNIADMWGSSG